MNRFSCVSHRAWPASSGLRRCWFVAVLATVLGWAPRVCAGSYLDRAALLVAEAAHEADYLRTHIGDRELARVVNRVARARLRTAQEMEIPKEVVPAHPHLLLVLEAYERAAAAVVEGRTTRFLEQQQRARDEEGILRGVLKEHGWTLPKG